MASNMIKLAGLWKREGKDGNAFYSGRLSYGTNLILFKNKYKESEKDPDVILYIGKAWKKEEEPPEEEGVDEEERLDNEDVPF